MEEGPISYTAVAEEYQRIALRLYEGNMPPLDQAAEDRKFLIGMLDVYDEEVCDVPEKWNYPARGWYTRPSERLHAWALHLLGAYCAVQKDLEETKKFEEIIVKQSNRMLLRRLDRIVDTLYGMARYGVHLDFWQARYGRPALTKPFPLSLVTSEDQAEFIEYLREKNSPLLPMAEAARDKLKQIENIRVELPGLNP